MANSNQWYFNKLVKIPCHKTPYQCPHRLNLSSQSSRSCAGPNIKVLKDKALEFANSNRTFNIDNSANPLKSKQLALITELFCPSMELLCRVSRGKTGEADTGKRDYRNLCGCLLYLFGGGAQKYPMCLNKRRYGSLHMGVVTAPVCNCIWGPKAPLCNHSITTSLHNFYATLMTSRAPSAILPSAPRGGVPSVGDSPR